MAGVAPPQFVNPMPRILFISAVYPMGVAIISAALPNRRAKRWFCGISLSLFGLAAGFVLYAIMSLQGLR
jgi:hypothetical protein